MLPRILIYHPTAHPCWSLTGRMAGLWDLQRLMATATKFLRPLRTSLRCCARVAIPYHIWEDSPPVPCLRNNFHYTRAIMELRALQRAPHVELQSGHVSSRDLSRLSIRCKVHLNAEDRPKYLKYIIKLLTALWAIGSSRSATPGVCEIFA